MTVLMIGLDGATFTLLDHFMSDGTMPYLKELVGRSVRSKLMSTRNPLTPPAWTTMTTGRSPEAHGIYDFLRPDILKDGGVFLKINDSRVNRCETIWSIASRSGKRVASLNYYGMSPPPEVNGSIVSGFVPWKHLRHGTYPTQLFEELKAMPGIDYRDLGMDISEEKKCVQGLLDGEHHDWISLQIRRDGAWVDLTNHLLSKEPIDLAGVVLDGPDKVQHLFWRFVDPAMQEGKTDAWHIAIREHCLQYYAMVDDAIRRMIEAAGPESDILITSDHGFGPTDEIVYINEWLSRRGYLTWADAAKLDDTGQLTADKMRDHLAMIDWRKTVAFSPTPSSNAIYIKKDNGSGVGVPEDGYLDFVMSLRKELLDYRNPSDGGQIFTGVDTNKLRGTSFVEPCPDLTVRLRDGGFVSILKSSQEVVARAEPDGTHRPEGIFIGHGPSFRAGIEIDKLEIVDIAPLMLTLAGVPVPSNFEGRVPTEILQSSVESTRGEATKVAGGVPEDAGEPSEEEREALMNRLRMLGYIE